MKENMEKYEEKYKKNHEEGWKTLYTLLKNEDMAAFRELFLSMHTYEQSKFFTEQDEESRLRIYGYLSPDEVAELFERLELKETEEYFREMDPRFSSAILEELPADDAVDILNLLDKDEVASLLTGMEKESADEVKNLLHYEEKTAGSIMTTEFVAINDTDTVNDVMDYLKDKAPDAETIYYIYVLDINKHLVGVLSLRDLLIADYDKKIEDIMSKKVVAVSVAKDQEEVAQIIMDYDFLAIPVVDFQNHLLGIITVDDILDVVEEEAQEDYSMLAGVSEAEKRSDNAWQAAKKRLPWLVILSFLGLFTATLIGQFEDTLDRVALLAIFIPLIGGMAGNTGTQSLAIAVRGLATGDLQQQGKMKLFFREIGTGLITGSVSGIILMSVIFIWHGNIALGALVGVSIMVSLVVATLIGTLVPIIMDRLNIDPAVASGPFITTINDIVSIFIYFGLATLLMGYLT